MYRYLFFALSNSMITYFHTSNAIAFFIRTVLDYSIEDALLSSHNFFAWWGALLFSSSPSVLACSIVWGFITVYYRYILNSNLCTVEVWVHINPISMHPFSERTASFSRRLYVRISVTHFFISFILFLFLFLFY